MTTTSADGVPWTGVVLAGGRSSRMGCDKAELRWQGRSLLAHMQALLGEAGAARVVVSGGRRAGIASVPDDTPECGPLEGVASVAARLPDGVLLLVPVDMPRLSVALLRRLAQAPAACATCPGQPLPMRLRLDDGTRATLAALRGGAAGGRSLRALHAALAGDTLPLAAEEAAQLAGCNTPEEWRALVQ